VLLSLDGADGIAIAATAAMLYWERNFLCLFAARYTKPAGKPAAVAMAQKRASAEMYWLEPLR